MKGKGKGAGRKEGRHWLFHDDNDSPFCSLTRHRLGLVYGLVGSYEVMGLNWFFCCIFTEVVFHIERGRMEKNATWRVAF